MNHRWLSLLVIAFITGIIFLFFWYRLQPVWTPEKAAEQNQTTATEKITTPTVSFVNPKKGASNPAITVVEFADYQCLPCRELSINLDVLLRTIPEVQLVWKDLPNGSAHELAVPSAVAGRCAAAQGKFWEYHDAIFDKQSFLSATILSSTAQEVGLDTVKFQNCFDKQDTLPLVNKDLEEATALQITATPTIFVGDERITGVVSAEEIISLVKTKMAQK